MKNISRIKYKKNILNTKYIIRNTGFTLIEVLISITIIVLVVIVTIPNFRRFIQSQDIDITSSEVLRVIRETQTNASSGIKCNNSSYPVLVNWFYKLKTVGSQTGFDQGAVCQNNASPPDSFTEVRNQGLFVKNISFSVVDTNGNVICPTTSTSINFSPSEITFYCDNTPINRTELVLNLTDTQTSKTTNIKINKGGALSTY